MGDTGQDTGAGTGSYTREGAGQDTGRATDRGPVRLGVIGLGAMGSEMLDVARRHPEFEVVLAADPSERALERVRERHPGLALSADPRQVVDHPGLDAVYIASPPVTHARYAVDAMKAGKAVFCEKPLAVSPADGAEMVAAAEASGVVNALNFALSDRSAALEVARAVSAGEAGELVRAEMRLLFPEWPRAFQREADWLAGREQGGFLREVASHFVFLTDRLLGPVETLHTETRYGPRSEVAAAGLLSAGGIPVQLSGQVAAGPESYEWTLYGSRRSYRITDWGDLLVGDAQGWHQVDPPGPRGSEESRLGEFAGAIRGLDSTLADFAAGLRVQHAIERFHEVNQ